ncbi:MAG: PAS domain S-box protein [Promethearchaeota archaeon]
MELKDILDRKDIPSEFREQILEKLEELEHLNEHLMRVNLALSKASEKSEEQFLTVINSIDEIIHVVDRDLRIIFHNDKHEQYLQNFNLDPNLRGKTIFEAFPFLPESVRDEYEHVFESGEPLSTTGFDDLGTQRIYTETRKIPILEAGRVVQVLTIVRDITERQKIENALRESEENYRTLVRTPNALFYKEDLEGNFLFVNEAFPETLGYSIEELHTMKGFDLVHPDDVPIIRELWGDLLAGKEVNNVEVRLRSKDGEYRQFVTTASPWFDADGELRVIIGAAQDITALKETERALAESEELYRTLFENAQMGVGIVWKSGGIIVMNDAMKKMLGGTAREVELRGGLGPLYVDPKEREEVLSVMERDGQLSERELHLKNLQGEEYWALVSSKIVKLRGREAYLTTQIDITAKKRVEQALRESEERFRLLAEQNLMATVILQDDLVKYANQATSEILEYTLDEILSWGVREYAKTIYEGDREFVMEQGRKKQAGEPDVVTHYEYRMITKSGELKWVENYSKTITYEGRPADLLTLIDITDRKKAEIALVKSELKLRYRVELEGVINQISRIFANNPVHHIDESIETSLQIVGDFFDVDHVALFQFSEDFRKLRKLQEYWKPRTEQRVVLKSIDVTPAAFLERILARKPVYFPQVEEMDENLPEARMLRDLGTKSMLLIPLSLATAIFGTLFLEATSQEKKFTKNDIGVLFTIGEIIVNALNRKRLEEQLQIRQRMDYLSTLVGGIAHDFNNILAGIIGNISLVKLDAAGLDESALVNLDEAERACTRAADLIKQLQTFSDRFPQKGEEVFDVRDIAVEVFDLLDKTTDRLIEKEVVVPPGEFYIKGRPSELNQVLLNLATNSIHAISAKGLKEGAFVRVMADDYESLGKADKTGLPAGHYVHLTFQDNGIGMSRDVVDKAFIPFFTTRRKGTQKGQGLGLAMVYRIVTQNFGGNINIDSTPGRGTTVHLYLPRAKARVLKRPDDAKPMASKPIASKQTILVVDDEKMIRTLFTRVLKRYGYGVLLAADGKEAVEVFKTHSREISAVILDLTMPGMTGVEVLDKILEVDPRARVIISTGHGDASLSKRITSRTKGILAKPYRVGDLIKKLRGVLEAE